MNSPFLFESLQLLLFNLKLHWKYLALPLFMNLTDSFLFFTEKIFWQKNYSELAPSVVLLKLLQSDVYFNNKV